MTRHVTSFALDSELQAFIDAQIASGDYRSASDVIRAALRQMADNTRKERWLRQALDAGEASAVAPDGVWERVHARVAKRRARTAGSRAKR
jgi:antitoxin ParD1/3/4